MKKFLAVWIVFLGLLAGCVTNSERKNAVTSVDLYWQGKNDIYMRDSGSRYYPISRYQAFVAGLSTFASLNMLVAEQSLTTGFILASAPAPVPLSSGEWDEVVAAETEDLRSIVTREVGILGRFTKLDPNFKDILVNLIVTEADQGSRLQLSFRLLNKTESGKVVRTQVPPKAVQIGVQKFWAHFEKQIGSAGATAALNNGPQQKYVTKRACINATDGGRSLNETRKRLTLTVRKLALAEIFKEYISSRTTDKDTNLDLIASDSFDIVQTKGDPRFYNGESLGEICVEGEYFVTAADIKNLAERTQ